MTPRKDDVQQLQREIDLYCKMLHIDLQRWILGLTFMNWKRMEEDKEDFRLDNSSLIGDLFIMISKEWLTKPRYSTIRYLF